MKHYFNFDTQLSYTAVAFGRFDCMHIGHRAVVKELASYENSVLVSFADNYNPVIYTELEKEYILKSFGVQNMITVSADFFEKMPVASFVINYIVGKLGAKTVVTGANYEYLSDLRDVCKDNNINLVVVPVVEYNKREVTTEIIKTRFKDSNADINETIKLLGDAYVMAGVVVHGKEAGRKHGIPTANLDFAKNKIWPKHGVYGTIVHIGDSRLKGITNVGLRPSADDIPVPTCETFIIDFDDQIYDTLFILEAFIYLRPVIKFPSLDYVKAQIQKDIKQINYSLHQ